MRRLFTFFLYLMPLSAMAVTYGGVYVESNCILLASNTLSGVMCDYGPFIDRIIGSIGEYVLPNCTMSKKAPCYTYVMNDPAMGSQVLLICLDHSIDSGSHACDECPHMGEWAYGPATLSEWTSAGNNVVSRTKNTHMLDANTGTQWGCRIKTSGTTYEYGCAADYYTTATTGTSTMTCTHCPTEYGATGHSQIGNMPITGCYINGAETSFNDTSGTGTFQDTTCPYVK